MRLVTLLAMLAGVLLGAGITAAGATSSGAGGAKTAVGAASAKPPKVLTEAWLRAHPGVTIGNTNCGGMSINPNTAVYGGEGLGVTMNWTANTGTSGCQMLDNACSGEGFFFAGSCDAGYWLVGVFCSTLAATDLANAQGDCDLNNIVVLTDDSSGPSNSGHSGTSYNTCTTVRVLGSIFGGLPGTIQCVTDNSDSDGWSESWGNSTNGGASGPFEETGSGVGFNPSTAGVDCPPSEANILAGAIANTCAFVVFPVNFEYYCVTLVCTPDLGAPNDGVSENTNDFLATTFQYQYAPSFTSGNSTSVMAGNALNFGIATNASPAATVTLNGTLPSGVSFSQGPNGTATLSGTPALSSAGTYNLTLTAANGVSPNATQSFTLTVVPRPPPPTVSGISPTQGPTGGGTTLTINGGNFTSPATVTVGGNTAGNVNVVSSTQLTVTTPPGSAGNAAVAVTTAWGSATSPTPFTYVPPPTINAGGMSPTQGPASGGTTVTLTGTNLNGTTSVHFGATAASNVVVVSSTQVTAVSPAGSGSVTVSLTTAGGTANAPGQFTYVPAPTISAGGVTPAAGPTTGGTPVTITGTNLTGTTSVFFGPNAATGVTVISPTSVTATSPAGSGTVTVSLSTIGGTATDANAFTYFPAPAGLAITPFVGSAGGGTTVTITGTALSGATSVTFGGTKAASYTVVSPTQITAVSPAGSGSVAVMVTTPGGTASATPEFTYIPGPTVSSLAPTSGPQAGGTAVTITGTGLSGATSVQFGSIAATFTDVTATSLVAFAPPGTGSVAVVVTTPGGTATSSSTFTYLAAGTITGISPTDGPASGGSTVTVTGTGLLGATAVLFGSQSGVGLTGVTNTSLTVTAPAGTGTVDVIVLTPGGPVVSPAQYTYVAAPTVTGISPATGPAAGGTTVTISGTGLGSVTAVDFGSTPATFGAVTDGTIVAQAPAGTGNVAVSVTTAGGSADAPLDFAYFGIPTVTSVAPADGPAAGGTKVTITGTSLGGATAVDFGATAGTLLGVGSTSITVLAPAGTGTVDVAVLTPAGTALSPDQYNYVAKPVVSAISPATGPPAGGITVTVNGSGFTGVTSVHFGPNAATIVTITRTVLTVTEPAGAGTVDVTVTTPGGTSAKTAKDRFTHVAAPKVTALTPTSGAPAGGSAVELIGTNLCNATSVTFGGVASASATPNASCTTLEVRSPAFTGGALTSPHPVAVVVTTPSGKAPAPVDFTYINPGYWMAGSNGAIYNYGGAKFYGSMGTQHLNEPIVAMADTPDHEGYWLFASDGGVFAFGDAKFFGSVPNALGPGHKLNAPIVAVEATADGRGYRMFAADGGVFDFGDAHYVGSLPGLHIKPNRPVVAATSDPLGQGYWLVGADGGVYTFPDAVFRGSLGGQHLLTSIVWMTNTVTGGGYWIFGADGSVWAMGDAHGFGAPHTVSAPICAGVATTTDAGYWLFGQDGGVYAYGDAPALGSLPSSHVHVDDIVGGIGF